MIDPNTLPKPLADFVAAQNEFKTAAFLKIFADNASVHDEGGEYHGTVEIKEWFETTKNKYNTHMDPIAYEGNPNESILTIKMSGTFPGSPLSVKFYFSIKDAKIISLRIE